MARLGGKIAMVVGAGQSPGQGVGNGRATALLFGREGATVVCVDRSLDAAEETAELIRIEGNAASAFAADITYEEQIKNAVAAALEQHKRIDVLHNNVGVSLAGGDSILEDLTEQAFDTVFAINLRGMAMTCKHVVPIMRAQRAGSIVNIGSTAVLDAYPYVAYKASKAGVIAFTEQLAYRYCADNVRANVILPGLMDTPMAVDTRAKEWGKSRAEVAAARDARVPLGNKMGTGWDVANAALFLASDDAKFITGVTLPVDGGASVMPIAG
ncbi:MAG: NAD(P)-dependent dehydrogenase (short-subunit alcohol dehydrogenase family) [Gammaproteobacteria bacterium]|jgi:NAD(P)-dependent dehydrogenase (short-subunit alcohol dehydrogenase family)